MSDQGAGAWPIKSCWLRRQVRARWTATAAAGYSGSEMASRAAAGLLLCGVALVFLVLLQGTQSVYIQYQGFRVQLKSVKKLSDLEGQWAPSPRLQAQSPQPSVCHHSALPPDLQPICQSEEAASIFQALSECPAPAEALAPHSLSSPHASSSTHVASAKPPG
uniref:Guanylate cyclase activator 2B n=1 Tax=Sus scrofa TaxID=9823 RepID=A0A8D1VYH6_PIG